MKIIQKQWKDKSGWQPSPMKSVDPEAQLVFVFGSTALLKEKERIDEINRAYPRAYVMGCSTAGEILATNVTDDTIVVTAIHFDHSGIQGAYIKIDKADDSTQVGEKLARMIKHENLVHVFVLSDGLNINGSDLVKGLAKGLPPNVTITGGLSADGARFQETLVFADGTPQRNIVSIVGLYGNRLKVGYGSLGGWDSFGPERIITRSRGNVLYELDGKSALELYKKYLGEHAQGLPATGLLFPLSLRAKEDEVPVVRTILSVDEKEQSMTFAGTVPEGARARLMKANFDRLIDGASGAAITSYVAVGSSSPDLAILISCVGRKLILKQRIEEEVEGVREVLGEQVTLTGFYSYGEISPFTPGAKCELHNQTMTITTLSER
jgi:hypothetical protein